MKNIRQIIAASILATLLAVTTFADGNTQTPGHSAPPPEVTAKDGNTQTPGIAAGGTLTEYLVSVAMSLKRLL